MKRLTFFSLIREEIIFLSTYLIFPIPYCLAPILPIWFLVITILLHNTKVPKCANKINKPSTNASIILNSTSSLNTFLFV